MILTDFKAFPRVGRVLGVDWGAVRTGVAITDGEREFTFARPVVVSKNRGADLAVRVAQIARDDNVVGIIVGLPLRTDGTESDTTSAVREFAKNLSEIIDVPIAFIDESLTSASAAEDMGLKTRAAQRANLDSESARVILENAIAMMRRA